MKPRRWYVVLETLKQINIPDLTGEVLKVPLQEKKSGIIGVLPVFTNKKKARKWGGAKREIIALEEKPK